MHKTCICSLFFLRSSQLCGPQTCELCIMKRQKPSVPLFSIPPCLDNRRAIPCQRYQKIIVAVSSPLPAPYLPEAILQRYPSDISFLGQSQPFPKAAPIGRFTGAFRVLESTIKLTKSNHPQKNESCNWDW